MLKLVRILNLTNFFMEGINHELNSAEQTQKISTNENLTPEQEKINSLKDELDTIKGSQKFVGDMENNLRTRLLHDGDPKDIEFKELADKVKNYQNTLKGLGDDENNIISQLSGLSSEIHSEMQKLSPEQLNKLKTISSREFLGVPEEKRLQYVTKNNIDSGDLLNKKVENIEFSFDQDGDGVDNQELFLLTTAGQVLPEEIKTISSDGDTYERRGTKGEFYNESGVRLKIYTGTEVQITELGDKSENKEINSAKYNEFMAKSDNSVEYSDSKYTEIINVAIEKGLEPEMFITAVERRVETFEKEENINDITLEIVATEISRAISGTKVELVDGKYDIDVAAHIFRDVTPVSWKENMKDYGYEVEVIDTYEKENPDNIKYDFGKVNNYIPSEYSSPVERSSSGTTLCSKTARLNLAKLGVEGEINRGSSARESYNMYNGDISHFPPSEDTGAVVADFYLDASSKNAEYGHRVAAFKEGGQWFVLDPYYNIVPGVDNRKPVPAETYISVMSAKGRNMWGAHYFS